MKKILSLVMCFAMALSFVQMSAYAGDAVETPDDEFSGNGNSHVCIYELLVNDEEGHWYECSRCREKENTYIETHEYTKKYDQESHYLYCDVCEYISGREDHLLNKVNAEKDGHTLACDCGYTTEILDHEYSNDCDKTCNTCNFARSVKDHKYTDSCDAYCNECKAKRSITHKYTTKTVKATTSKSGYVLTECSVCGADKSKTTIYYPKTVKLSYETCTYTGKTRTPGIVVKDSKGKTISSKYYTVTTPKTRKYVGKYKYTIKFKGNYSGTKTLYLTINPKAASINKLTAKNKAIAVKLNRSLKQSTGYQIQYSTSKKFTSAKTKTLKSYKTSTVTLSGLKAKKTYYVRVRTYKTVDGKKYYSNWSSYKYKKTK